MLKARLNNGPDSGECALQVKPSEGGNSVKDAFEPGKLPYFNPIQFSG